MIEQKKHKQSLFFLFLLLSSIFVISINAGYVDIPLADVLKAFWGIANDEQNLIVLNFRIPRMYVAMLVGVGFALSGLLLQGLTRNDLADPGIIGVNAGAMFAVFIVIFLSGKGFYFSSYFSLPFISIIGSFTFGFLIYVLSTDKHNGANPIKIILNGVAVQTGLSALMVFAVLLLDENQYDMLMKWLNGSLWRSNMEMVYVLLPWIVFGIIVLYKNARNLDAFTLGDDLAIGIGVDVKKVKQLMLVMAVLLSGVSVAISGTISFVGLIAPHIAKRLFGVRHKVLIPGCALIGAILVLLGDTLGRLIIMPSEIPAGVMVAIIGAPYFLTLLFRNVAELR
ncbi:MAG: FecCD family ABC transporter permease [Lachnospirales bacterium]